MVLTDENGFWNYKKASINTLVVSHNNNIPFSYFANVKHTWNSMQTVALINASKTRLPFNFMCFVSTQGKYRYSFKSNSSFIKI